jgi:hypothetical protein
LIKPQSNRRSWIWLSALLIFFMLSIFFISSQKPITYPNYVSDSPSPTGVKAFYTYLKKESVVKSWTHSPKLLPRSAGNQILVMIEPVFIPNKEEMDAYIDFVAAGNTLLLFKHIPEGMFDLNTGPVKETPSLEKDSRIFGHDKTTYRAEISSLIRLLPNDSDQVLLEDQAGVIALKRTVGNGQLIVTNTPEWITNGNLLTEDHLALILTLLNEGNPDSFLVDEYTHSTKNASTFLTLYPKWFLLLSLQGILLTILWLWYKGRRFGPLHIAREESVRLSDEGIHALAAWYLRGNRYHDSLEIQADYVKDLLQERWQIPYSTEWKSLSSNFERKWTGLPTSEVGPFLNGLTNVLEKKKVSKQEYLLWSRKLERLRKEVDEG